MPALALHSPPPTVSVSVVVAPLHTAPAPVIAVGDKLTVTVVVVLQPEVVVKVTIATPVLNPVTIPVDVPIAMGVLLLAHVPLLLSVRLMFEPTQTADGPPIAADAGFTVTAVVT